MDEYGTGERRMEDRKGVCDLHSGLNEAIIRIEKSQENNTIVLNAIAQRQFEYIERQIKLEGIVTNGLSSNVAHIKKQLDEFCGEASRRLAVVETFAWFRTWVTGLRDNMFKNLLLLAIIGGSLFIVIHYGEGLLKRLLP